MPRKRKARKPGQVGSKKPPSAIYSDMVKAKLATQPNGHGTGRPTVYNEDLANELCARLSGGQSLKSICGQDDMPSESSVMRWLFDPQGEKAGFWERYSRARKAYAEVLADEVVPIADDADIERPAAVNKARAQIDARRWAASVFNRSRFGDKPHVAIQNNQTLVTTEDPRELARRLALALTDITPSD